MLAMRFASWMRLAKSFTVQRMMVPTFAAPPSKKQLFLVEGLRTRPGPIPEARPFHLSTPPGKFPPFRQPRSNYLHCPRDRARQSQLRLGVRTSIRPFCEWRWLVLVRRLVVCNQKGGLLHLRCTCLGWRFTEGRHCINRHQRWKL